MPPPPCVTSVGLWFLYGALDSHPFFPSHVASGRCVLSAAAAAAPAGVVSAFAEPSSWCAGAVLNVAGCAVCASAAPSSWRIGGCAGGCGGRVAVFAALPPPPPPGGRGGPSASAWGHCTSHPEQAHGPTQQRPAPRLPMPLRQNGTHPPARPPPRGTTSRPRCSRRTAD